MIALTYILGFVIVAVMFMIPSGITFVLGIVSALSLLSFGVLWNESPNKRAIWWMERIKLYVTKFRIVETRYSATSDLYEFAVQRQEFGLTWHKVYSTGLKDKEKGLQSANAQLTYIINRMENAAFPLKRIVMEARSINELRKDPNE